MMENDSIRTAPENTALKPGEQKMSVKELSGFIENARLAFYRGKDNYSSVINQFMGAVDMAQQTIFALKEDNDLMSKKIIALEAKLKVKNVSKK